MKKSIKQQRQESFDHGHNQGYTKGLEESKLKNQLVILEAKTRLITAAASLAVAHGKLVYSLNMMINDKKHFDS